MFSTKFGDWFCNLMGIKCMKLCSNPFRFDLSIVRCLGGSTFLPDTLKIYLTSHIVRISEAMKLF